MVVIWAGMLIFFCYTLHVMCNEKGVKAFGYLAAMIGGFIAIIFGTSIAAMLIYGVHIAEDPDMPAKLAWLTPFTVFFHFMLFFLLRRRLAKLPGLHNDDDDKHSPPPSDEKKDLSYFR